MRLLPLLLAAATLAHPAEWSLESLYTRPFPWGTSPEKLQWAKNKPVLGFLWNEDGQRFLELYAWHAESRRRVRLTRLAGTRDEFNPLPDENDERLKANRLPEAGLSQFHLSADGARAVFTWRGDLYLVPTDGSAPPLRLTQTRAGESSPQFSEDGTRLAYLRNGELYVLTLATGQVIQLTEGNTISAAWAPDGRSMSYVTFTPGQTRTQIVTNYSGRFTGTRPIARGAAGDELGTTARFVVAATGGKPRQLPDPFPGQRGSAGAPVWSPDSKSLSVGATSADRHTRQVWVYDARTAKGRSVFEWTDDRWVYTSSELWSPDSKTLLISSDRDGFIHLYTVPAAGGAATQITRGKWELDSERFGYDPQWIGNEIVYCSTEAGTHQRQVYSIRPDGAGKRQLSRREGLNVGQRSEDGRYLALLEADLKQPWDLYVNEERVTTSPRATFANYAWPETRFIDFPSRGDGATVKAKLLLPPGYDPQKRYPCLFFIHGAGIASSILAQWGSYQEHRYVFNAYMANKGYVIMDLDYRGSSGYGRDWRTGVYLHMGGPDLDDVLGAVDFLKKQGNIDMDRLGIWGVSYGGFMTNMALFLSPGTFRAGSAWAAVNDWENYNPGYTQERLTTPAKNPEAYRRSSPITFAPRLKDHLQMVHGIGDSNVLFQEAVQLSEVLIREGKRFDEIFYPQEDHGFLRDETLQDSFRRAAAFFDQYLQPGK